MAVAEVRREQVHPCLDVEPRPIPVEQCLDRERVAQVVEPGPATPRGRRETRLPDEPPERVLYVAVEEARADRGHEERRCPRARMVRPTHPVIGVEGSERGRMHQDLS